MIAIALQSGSNGNCIYVETPDVKLLFDAGISGIQAETRLKTFSREIRDVDALIVSHEHADHIKCAGVYHRKYGIPVYISSGTFKTSEKYSLLGPVKDVQRFKPGEQLTFGKTVIQTVPTPHDCIEGSAFTVSAGGRNIGILTDLGHPFKELQSIIKKLDGVFLESNYDPDMLSACHYPEFLKARIRGERGHISNHEAAELLLSADRLKWACLAHLSENSNTPEMAIKTHRKVMTGDYELFAASRYSPSGLLRI